MLVKSLQLGQGVQRCAFHRRCEVVVPNCGTASETWSRRAQRGAHTRLALEARGRSGDTQNRKSVQALQVPRRELRWLRRGAQRGVAPGRVPRVAAVCMGDECGEVQ